MPRFSYPVQVKATDIDSLKHVNNEVYLRWTIEAATAHSDSLGFPMKRFFELGAAFVVKRHELDYMLPAFLNESLRVETWTEKFEGSRGIRHYHIVRESDQKSILKGTTTWVYVDLKTGRPQRIPQEVHDAFTEPSAS